MDALGSAAKRPLLKIDPTQKCNRIIVVDVDSFRVDDMEVR